MKTKLLLILFAIAMLFATACSVSTGNKESFTMEETKLVVSTDKKSYRVQGTPNHETQRKDEYEPWGLEYEKEYEDPNAPKTMTIEFDGKQYSGSYKYTKRMTFATYRSAYYKNANCWFVVDPENGELQEFGLYKPGDLGEKTLEECRPIAEALANKYINTEDYQLIMNTDERSVNTYVYTKYIDGVETCARLSIVTDLNGDIKYFGRLMTDEVEAAIKKDEIGVRERIKNLCSADSEKTVEEKIDSIYTDTKNFTKEITNKTIVVLDDDSIGVVYSVRVETRTGPIIIDGQECYRIEPHLNMVLIR